MITIILFITSFAVIVLLIGFLDIHLPFIVSKTKKVVHHFHELHKKDTGTNVSDETIFNKRQLGV